MAISKTKHGCIITLVGTDAEVAQALNDNRVAMGTIISLGYNGSNTTARYFAGVGRNIVRKTIGSQAVIS